MVVGGRGLQPTSKATNRFDEAKHEHIDRSHERRSRTYEDMAALANLVVNHQAVHVGANATGACSETHPTLPGVEDGSETRRCREEKTDLFVDAAVMRRL